MPRHGRNPMAWTERLESPAKVTLTTIVHIPSRQGFWSESLDVLERCLDSMSSTAPADSELLVLDNGSCDEVRDFLTGEFAGGPISQLILSQRNLGKVGAWNLLFSAAQGDYVSYADSDVHFRPGWFEASLAILEAYPRAAMVTAQPIPGDLSLHCDATVLGALDDPEVEVCEGKDLIPPHFVDSHRLGLGETVEQYAPRIADRRDVALRRRQVDAFVSASHFQFTTRRDVLDQFFPLPTSIPLGDDVELDRRLDAASAWRLSTAEYLVHHMGNRLPDLAAEMPWARDGGEPTRRGARQASDGRSPNRNFGQRLARSHRVRQWVKWLHRQTYEMLYPG